MKLFLLVSMLIFGSVLEFASSQDDYYTGNYDISCNLYCFNVNILAWLHNRNTAPPLETFAAIEWAKQAGFTSVNIPMYYITGYEGTAMPSQPIEAIRTFIQQVKDTARREGLKISGTGIGNDFANPDPLFHAVEIQRALFWIDMAAEMGAPFIRIFSGIVPADLDASGGWAAVTQSRIVPALKTITAHAATKGVKIGLQNHGDMTATADQTIQVIKWVDNPNIGIVDDTGYFRPFQATTGLNYDWYSDINKVLPYSVDFQAKLKPAGADQSILMDFDKLFTGVRSSPYRLPLNLERLWFKDDPDRPNDQPTPPYKQVEEFLATVKASLERTKTPPSRRI